MSHFNRPVSNASGWTKSDIESFLTRERLGYQKVSLPYGLSTPGTERQEFADTILGDVRGKTVLDVGSNIGYFCLEALARGATRAVGWEIQPERVRQARSIAAILGAQVEYVECDVEHATSSSEMFDIVLCLNLLHHALDPIRLLDKLIAVTRERLILEIASLGSHDRRKLGLSAIRAQILSQQPVIVLGRGRVGYQKYFFTATAIETMLRHHRTHFAKVATFRSGFKDRFAVIADRRRINHLIVIAGPTASGKSTLIKALRTNRLRQLNKALGVSDFGSCPFVGAKSVQTIENPQLERLLFHYDFLRPFHRAKTFERDEGLHILETSRRISVVTLWTPLDRLRYQLVESDFLRTHVTTPTLFDRSKVDRLFRLGRLFVGRLRHRRQEPWHQQVHNLYQSPDAVMSAYLRWFQFCDAMPSITRHAIVEFNRDVRLMSRAEWNEVSKEVTVGNYESSVGNVPTE